MEDAVARMIQGIKSWEELYQFEVNARDKGRLTNEIVNAIASRGSELGRALIASKTGLDLNDLTLAEEKIIEAVSAYVAVKRTQGKYPQRTFDQLRNRGLIGAAESSVCRLMPTLGFQTLVDEDLEALSYEQIVVDHPNEFSPRALWFSRKTLGMPVEGEAAPAEIDGDTQARTALLIEWLKARALSNEGRMPPFTNNDAADAMGMSDMQRYGQVHGNIQSRIDYACFVCGLPPLGLAAVSPFDKAWDQQNQKHGREWSFPVRSMQVAAQTRHWSADEFDHVLRETEKLPGQSHIFWKEALAANQSAVRDWAMSFGDEHLGDGKATEKSQGVPRNPIWSRDELILALHLYLHHRASPPAKGSPEVSELSVFLGRMGKALGQGEAATYRNTNGVYMKMMNFRTSDPEYTQDGKVGLSRGNKDEKVVWAEFADNIPYLDQVALAIRRGVEQHIDDDALLGVEEPGCQEAAEGRVLTRLHRFRERSRKLVEICKQNAMRRHGRLCCEACGFDFSVAYGDVGNGLMDVHHTRPVHTLLDGEKTNVKDLALLCANCHRVVHSSRRWLTVEQVKALLSKH